jgi:antitoxin (DNA-binding transcriptional repressor) of toxin-antitoxin stability system
MAFTIKEWTNRMVTRLNAAALQDLEERLSDYTDSVAAGGIELGYASRTTDFTQTGSGNSDVTSLSVTVTVGTRPINVIISAAGMTNSSASGLGFVNVKEGSTVLGYVSAGLSTANEIYPVNRVIRLAPSAGSHTYKVNLSQFITGNTTLKATSDSVASIQVIEV